MLNRLTRSVLSITLLTLAAVVAMPTSSYGQTFRGGINGTVADGSGAVVAGASVEAEDTATGVSHKTVTSSAGEYSFQDMPLGTYKVTVIATSFKSAVVSGVPVTAGVIYTLPIKLSVQTTGETVEVSATDLALDTTTTTQTTVIPEQTVQNIPLNGRDFTRNDRNGPGLRRLCSWWLRVGERHSRESGQLADRWFRQQRLVAQHPRRQPGWC